MSALSSYTWSPIRSILRRPSPYLREKHVFLGGGIVLKYGYRRSEDLDFFSWSIERDEFYVAFPAAFGYNRIVGEPAFLAEDPETHETVKIELMEKKCPKMYALTTHFLQDLS